MESFARSMIVGMKDVVEGTTSPVSPRSNRNQSTDDSTPMFSFAGLAGFGAADHAGQQQILNADDEIDSDDDDDDYCDEDLDENDLMSSMEGPLMVKDWDEGDFFECYATLTREHLSIYWSDDLSDEEDEDIHEEGDEGGF